MPGLLCLGTVVCVLMLYVAPTSSVVVSNIRPRLDSATGQILELGDGSLHKFGDKYYLYGVKYVCTPSPHTPLFYGCPKKDRRIWGNMSIGVASSTVVAMCSCIGIHTYIHTYAFAPYVMLLKGRTRKDYETSPSNWRALLLYSGCPLSFMPGVPSAPSFPSFSAHPQRPSLPRAHIPALTTSSHR